MNEVKKPERGSVREDLIRAGVEILAQPDPDNLTLRRIAARAGVSHAAPAHYFEGLPGLRVAIAIRGFTMFAEAMEAAEAEAPDDAFERLNLISLTYIDFSERYRGLFRLMFDELVVPTPELSQIAIRSYLVLQNASRPFADPSAPSLTETAIWSLIHGFATLNLGRPRAKSAPFPQPNCTLLLRKLVQHP